MRGNHLAYAATQGMHERETKMLEREKKMHERETKMHEREMKYTKE